MQMADVPPRHLYDRIIIFLEKSGDRETDGQDNTRREKLVLPIRRSNIFWW